MSDPTKDFNDLPETHQQIIRLAQEKFNIKIVPLQELVGGWSGAFVFLVSVASNETNRVEHCILKLDRKGKFAKADEITRHNAVLSNSPPAFVREHVPELVFDRIEHDGVIAIFYRIAGQSLFKYRPLSAFEHQSQLESIIKETYRILLVEWNAHQKFEQGVHPQYVLEKWLGFRLKEGGNIENYLQTICKVDPNIPGLLINGDVFPNPLSYARHPEQWGGARPIDVAIGFLHRDLNTNNILVKFSEKGEKLDGYYLIDFALFKSDMPLFYDQRYLEMSYLMLTLSQVSLAKILSFLTLLAEKDIPDPQKGPIEMSGVGAVIASARNAFSDWVRGTHPSLFDDLWGQYWLAGVAAGLGFVHKAGQSDEQRLAGLIFAAANLKRYLEMFNLPLPTEAAFFYDVKHSQQDPSGLLKTKKPLRHLPLQPTRFIGRDEEVSALKALLTRRSVRLITLLGPGGTGKTRLSLQAAEEVLDDFTDGVTFVPLVDDTDAQQMISRIAQFLEVKEGGRPLLENVKDFLRDKNLLLILDNFEQLIDSAPIVADMLGAAPGLKIMITSRIALNLQGEHNVQIPPMALPHGKDGFSLEDLTENESVALFLERAGAAVNSFSLTKENAIAVVEICRRLDGLPLALELAAARIKLLTPQAILSRLDNRLKLLTGGASDLPARHKTLRNTLLWSYDLLGRDEKTLFTRLSVFAGGFTIEAAEAICSLDDRIDILESLTALVNNSLIRKEETTENEPRFRMLATIREFALEQLTERGELERIQEKHARYFGEIVINRVGSELLSEKALYWLNWTERELSNIRTAMVWSLSETGDIALGVQIVFSLVWFWYRRGYFIEGLTWAEQILARPELQEHSLMRALGLQASGILAIWKGEQDKGLPQLEESLVLLQRAEEERYIAYGLISNAVGLINMGRDNAARPLLEQAREIFREVGMNYFLTIALVHLGNVELGLGHPQKAREILEEAESIARTLNENWILSFVLNNLGEVARTQGEYDLARGYYQECADLLRDTNDRGDMARFVHSLAYIDQHEGNLKLAESQFRKGLAMFRRLGNRRGIAECLAGLAGVKARGGHLEWGAAMLGAAKTLLESTGGAWWPADRVEVERTHELIKSSLEEDVFTKAWRQGKLMDIDQAIQFATHEK